MPDPSLPTQNNTERRERVLAALADGEFNVACIAAWAELSPQQTRADLRWLAREPDPFAVELDGRWSITDKGASYLVALPAEVTW